MTDQAVVKVGDVVAWSALDNGTLVRWIWQHHGREYYVKVRGGTSAVCNSVGEWVAAKHMNGNFDPAEPVTVIAMDLTGNETADELRALAEKFDREHPSA